MQFLNPGWDGKRGIVGDAYREWIEESDFGKVSVVSRRVAGAMQAVGGRAYIPMQAVGLFPTSGASDDYAYSRHRANAALNKAHGFTMEFGYPKNFYPTLAGIPRQSQRHRCRAAGVLPGCIRRRVVRIRGPALTRSLRRPEAIAARTALQSMPRVRCFQ